MFDFDIYFSKVKLTILVSISISKIYIFSIFYLTLNKFECLCVLKQLNTFLLV